MFTLKMQREKAGRRKCRTNRGQEVMSEQEKGSHTMRDTTPDRKDEGLL